MIPGDTATPIAEKLADFSTYFLVVICAIYLEKYLVTITGYAAFGILIPLACVLLAVHAFRGSRALVRAAAELAESDAEDTEGETEKKGFFGGLISNVQNSVSNATDKVESVLNRFIEALAVLLVTSCVIPILVLVFFVWVIKMVMNTMSVSDGLTAGEW